MMRSMICIRWLLSRKTTLVFSILPRRSTVDVLRTVDQDVADRRVLQQHFQRTEAEGLVEHFVDQPLALVAVQQRVFGVAEMLDDQADFAAEHVAFQLADPGQVELVDQLAVDARLSSSNSVSDDFSPPRRAVGRALAMVSRQAQVYSHAQPERPGWHPMTEKA